MVVHVTESISWGTVPRLLPVTVAVSGFRSGCEREARSQ